MKIIQSLVLTAATVFMAALVTPSAHAYGGIGHHAFCEITYTLVQPATRARLDAMVAEHPDYDDFGSICSWADHIKSNDQWDWAKPHHYVNFPRSEAKVRPENCSDKGCILSAIQHHYDVLKHDPNDWVALAFLVHFMGDLHQPMHVSFADDLGGNRASLVYFDQPTNLHRLWDTDMLAQRGGEQSSAKAQELTKELEPLAPLSVNPEQTLAWANESAAITRRIYSNYREGQEIADDYTAQWGPVLEQRMQQGAQRLAAILDGLYARTNN
ncbi:S1/P1 nuclease [Pseudidiomarina woesei]|uniref:S1/P1 Nuclease n=1 Tax=Pseudidiomarina woesei TaxID=1381080 RepID=A0A0K6HCB6_9GAMM|nr:S1/P1 nuclease [Pseudidiomarina woesei]CUA88614.1 S1/P1 Nuclease [Pseudidiomarina woesei]